jgi:Aminoglycoside-2''-adenylyltransferase
MAEAQHPLGRWRPWRPREVAAFFAMLPIPWWIAGGWAIDLFLGRQTRRHEDIDVLILRQDCHAARSFSWRIPIDNLAVIETTSSVLDAPYAIATQVTLEQEKHEIDD